MYQSILEQLRREQQRIPGYIYTDQEIESLARLVEIDTEMEKLLERQKKVLSDMIGQNVRWMHGIHVQTGLVVRAIGDRLFITNLSTGNTRWIRAADLVYFAERRMEALNERDK